MFRKPRKKDILFYSIKYMHSYQIGKDLKVFKLTRCGRIRVVWIKCK